MLLMLYELALAASELITSPLDRRGDPGRQLDVRDCTHHRVLQVRPQIIRRSLGLCSQGP